MQMLHMHLLLCNFMVLTLELRHSKNNSTFATITLNVKKIAIANQKQFKLKLGLRRRS